MSQFDTQIISGENLGEGASLLEDPKHIRADARLIAKMVSLGVVPTATAETLLEKSIALAVTEAEAGKARNLATLLRAIISLARLPIEKQAASRPTVALQQNFETPLPQCTELDRKRRAQADLAELHLKERSRELIPIDEVLGVFAIVADSIRRAGETIGRIDRNSQTILLKELETAEKQIAAEFGSVPAEDQADAVNLS